jgi:hypothetical protein
MGLNKSTYYLREVNRSTVLYGFCMDEIAPVIEHPALQGSLEEVRAALNIPEDGDHSLLADILKKRDHAKNMMTDFKGMMFYDSQACQIIQVKNLDYMKAYRGNASLHETTIKRIETTDRAKARVATAEAKEKKDTPAPPKVAGKAPQTGSGKGGASKKPYSRPKPPSTGPEFGRKHISTYGGPNNCKFCNGPAHLGYACPPRK